MNYVNGNKKKIKMIVDTLKNARLYYGLNDNIKTALEYLEKTNLENLPCSKHEISGTDIFIIVEEYNSKPIEQGRWEAHRKYTDIQIVIKGEEKLGYTNVKNIRTTIEYDAEKDILFGEGNGSFINASAGNFLIFTPEDAHMPGIAINSPSPVKKAVIKVKC